MGHILNFEREYYLLQKRLDHDVRGAPESPTFIKILKILFSPEEAKLARKLSSMFISSDIIAKKAGIPLEELNDKLSDMAQRGLVIDLEHNGKKYFALAPVVIGFFEFVFMRTRDDLLMSELAGLFDQYMFKESSEFAGAVFGEQTQFGRILVREESLLLKEDHSEILDWERASYIIKSSSNIAVSLCSCRHKASHLGKACDSMREACMSLNHGADYIIRNGMGRAITVNDALKVLDKCKQENLLQIGENIQKKVTFICNCCGCCCGFLEAIKLINSLKPILISKWIPNINLNKCNGCRRCNAVCPINAIDIVKKTGVKNKYALLNENICLGCGVCYSACKQGAITMLSRSKRVYTPETIFDQMIIMAIERGKLANLIFENTEKLTHRALWRIIHIIEKSPPFKAAIAIKPLRSIFLNALVKSGKKAAGELVEKLI